MGNCWFDAFDTDAKISNVVVIGAFAMASIKALLAYFTAPASDKGGRIQESESTEVSFFMVRIKRPLLLPRDRELIHLQ